jgi:flagellar motor switch protein FliG
MGNLLRHGVDMYKQTINLKDNPKHGLETSQDVNNPAAEFFKVGKTPKSDKLTSNITEQKDSKYKRVAKFLILIGSEQAAGILKELDQDQIDEISKEIALIKTISPDERDEIMAEFHALFSRPWRFSGSSRGGIETARRILYAAKGPVKGEALLNRAIPESRENYFSFLEDFLPEQLAMLLKTETDQTAALILARLSPKLSAETLNKISAKRKPEILKRIAYQGEVFPEVLEQVSSAFKEKVRHISGGAKDIEIDGVQTLAAILKQGDYTFGDKLINELEAKHPKIGKEIKEKYYTLDDVINTIDRPIQDKLKIMTEKDIALLLKGRDRDITEKILSCVSAGRRAVIREEYDVLGAVPKRDCDDAAKEFLGWFRVARERGEIILYSDEDVFYE